MTNKTIAFDMRALDGASRWRGIGQYIVQVTGRLIPKLVSNNNVILYIYDEANLGFLPKKVLDKCQIVKPPASKVRIKMPEFWQRFLNGIYPLEYRRAKKLPHIRKVDIFYQSYFELGIPTRGKTKSIMVAYDLIPLYFEDQFFKTKLQGNGPRKYIDITRHRLRKHFYKKNLNIYTKASQVIAISQFTKDSFIEKVGVNPDRISAIPLGPPAISNKKTPLPKSINPKIPYILYIGGIDYRRDLVSLIEAYELLHQKNPIQLVLAGWDFEHIHLEKVKSRLESAHFQENIVNLGFVDDKTKQALYKNAVAFVYPTFFEGFGLNILEAFSLDCPFITYKNTAIPEAGGNAVIYVKGHKDIARSVQKLMNSDDARQHYIKAGRDRVKRFSWDKCAYQTMDEINSLTL